MSAPGMWQPKQKDGKNWEVFFSLEVVGTGEKIADRRRTFRVVADARDWIATVKNQTVEANQIKEPNFKGFIYSQPAKI